MKYKLTADSIGYLEATVEANSREEAWEILENMLDNGEMLEVDGCIENKEVEEL